MMLHKCTSLHLCTWLGSWSMRWNSGRCCHQLCLLLKFQESGLGFHYSGQTLQKPLQHAEHWDCCATPGKWSNRAKCGHHWMGAHTSRSLFPQWMWCWGSGSAVWGSLWSWAVLDLHTRQKSVSLFLDLNIPWTERDTSGQITYMYHCINAVYSSLLHLFTYITKSQGKSWLTVTLLDTTQSTANITKSKMVNAVRTLDIICFRGTLSTKRECKSPTQTRRSAVFKNWSAVIKYLKCL